MSSFFRFSIDKSFFFCYNTTNRRERRVVQFPFPQRVAGAESAAKKVDRMGFRGQTERANASVWETAGTVMPKVAFAIRNVFAKNFSQTRRTENNLQTQRGWYRGFFYMKIRPRQIDFCRGIFYF